MQNQQTQNLSARWTYPERETLVAQADKRCFGDVTGWAKSTTFFRRPDDVEIKREFHAIHNLRSIRPVVPRPDIHDQTVVIAPHVTKFDPDAHNMKVIQESLAFARRLEAFTESRIKRKRADRKQFLAEQQRQDEIKAAALSPVSQEEVKARYTGITVPRE